MNRTQLEDRVSKLEFALNIAVEALEEHLGTEAEGNETLEWLQSVLDEDLD